MHDNRKINDLLERWSEWHHMDTDIDIGYPSKAAGFATGGIKDFEDMCERADQQAMRSVDAAVNSLPHAQAAAILHEYGICTVFRFPRMNREQLIDDAMIRLEVLLRKKGVI